MWLRHPNGHPGNRKLRRSSQNIDTLGPMKLQLCGGIEVRVQHDTPQAL